MTNPVPATPAIPVERINAAVKAAMCSRGQNKGRLLRSAPPSREDGYAAWQAIVSWCNPYKASMGAMFFMSPDQRAIYNAVDDRCRGLKAKGLDLRQLDRDRVQLELWGAW